MNFTLVQSNIEDIIRILDQELDDKYIDVTKNKVEKLIGALNFEDRWLIYTLLNLKFLLNLSDSIGKTLEAEMEFVNNINECIYDTNNIIDTITSEFPDIDINLADDMSNSLYTYPCYMTPTQRWMTYNSLSMDYLLEHIKDYLKEYDFTINKFTKNSCISSLQSPGIGLQLIAKGFTSPLVFKSSGDGTGRIFIADQTGLIKILMPNGKILETPFLDIRNKIVNLDTIYDERGLLGLAFHPNYRHNGRFFVYYSGPLRQGGPRNYDHTNYISEFNVSDDPDIANSDSERVLLIDDHPEMNHNAGQIVFGPDGYLYIPIGDGGGANDEGLGHMKIGNAQCLRTIMGKILRINIDVGDPYSIPGDNPFINGEIPEIYAYGLRNPYRITFDEEGTHQLFALDVGQELWEEVDIIQKGGNYGWNIKEGTHCFDKDNPLVSPPTCRNIGYLKEHLIDPIIEIQNSHYHPDTGLTIAGIGGYVYRGSEISELYGSYIFGGWTRSWDNADGDVFVANPTEGMWPVKVLQINTTSSGRIGEYVISFGQDDNRELYVMTSENSGPVGNTGKIYKIIS